MNSTVMLITPEIAREMLSRNIENNRRINHSRVNGYATIMAAGKWGLHHQGIAFDDNGRLIDGQHRLLAIIRANTPVKMLVTTDVKHDDNELLFIDVGYKRSDANILQISGIDDPVRKEMSSVVRMWWYHKRPGGQKPSYQEVQDYIMRHYDKIERLYEITKCRKHGGGNARTAGTVNNIQAIVCAALLGAMYRGLSEEIITKFCNIYRYNNVDDCEEYSVSAVLNLRDWIKKQKNSDHYAYKYVENSIRAFAENRKIVRVKECYPYIAEFDS